MKKQQSSKTPGQFAFIAGENAKDIMPAAWLMSFHDPAERSIVLSRFVAFRERVCSLDCHHLLSLTGLYTLTGGEGALQRNASYPEVAELEFLQALALAGGESDMPPLAPDDVMPLWRELSTQCYVSSLGEQDDSAELNTLARMHAAYYRNPYGDEFFDRMVLTITKEYDKRYIRDGGFARAGLALIKLRREIWGRYLEYDKSRRIALTSTRSEVLELLRRLIPEMAEERFTANFGSL